MKDHRKSQLTGRDRLRQLRTHNEQTDDDMGLQRHRFATLADPASATRVVTSFNLFQTPPDLARRCAELLAEADPSAVLEPSAGLGRLYYAARQVLGPAIPLRLVEQSADCCRELYVATERDSLASLTQGDFLSQSPAVLGQFPGIIMNPPFKMGADVKHIEHALTFLPEGGRLVAICAQGSRRDRLRNSCSQWIPLPAGAFKSEGTHVEAAIIVFDR
jgi:hypothetical protein